MNKRNTWRMSCTCSGYWFIHRMGSLYCHYRSDGVYRQPDDLDYRDRQLD